MLTWFSNVGKAIKFAWDNRKETIPKATETYKWAPVWLAMFLHGIGGAWIVLNVITGVRDQLPEQAVSDVFVKLGDRSDDISNYTCSMMLHYVFVSEFKLQSHTDGITIFKCPLTGESIDADMWSCTVLYHTDHIDSPFVSLLRLYYLSNLINLTNYKWLLHKATQWDELYQQSKVTIALQDEVKTLTPQLSTELREHVKMQLRVRLEEQYRLDNGTV